MTAGPTSVTYRLWLGGAWVDVTQWVEGELSVHCGRTSEFQDIGASDWSFALDNSDGRFTPRSAVSPYFPYLVSGVLAQILVTQGGITYYVRTGKVVVFEPTLPKYGMTGALVRVPCADAIGTDLDEITLEDRWTETARALARAAGTWVDLPVLDGDETATDLDNTGTTTTSLGVATAPSSTGGLSFGSPTGITLARSASFAPSSGTARPVKLVCQSTPQGVDFWLQVPASAPVTTAAVLTCVNASSSTVGSVWLQVNGSALDLVLRTGAGTTVGVLAAGVADGAWRRVQLRTSATPTSVDGNAGGATVTAAWDLRTTSTLWWGATQAGTSGATCTVAGPVVAGAALALPASAGMTGQTAKASAQFAALASFCPTVTSWAYTGSEDRTIGEPQWNGKTASAVLQQLARTINGVGWCRGDGAVELIAADIARPATPVATLQVEQDVDADTAPTLRDAVVSRPTRVTITYSGGQTTLVDSTAEAGGRRVPVTIDTCATDQAAAVFAGSYAIKAGDDLRLSKVAVNLPSTLTDLWAVFLGLFPSQLLGTSGWNALAVGATSKNVHVEGWDLTVDEGVFRYVLDCSPAGLFPSAAWDGGDEYGRWSWEGATVTGGTALGVTGTGTAVVTFSGTGNGLSTSAGDYPLYLAWNGEIVRIDSPPGGSTSPQTVTIAARGQMSTAAQTHPSGQSIDLYHAAVWGF